MKKFIYIIAAVCSTLLCVNACKCTNGNDNFVEKTIVENKAWMVEHYGPDYRWYETSVVYNDYLDEETDGSYTTVSSVFYYSTIIDSTSFVPSTVIFTVKNGVEQVPEITSDVWVGDCTMTDIEIVLTFRDAFDRVMEANYSKPHSRNCVLRKELGPVDCNPQYVFGNVEVQLYVDSVTGEVTDENPAYKGFRN